MMSNNNCLEGLLCPNCGAEEPFRIYVEASCLVYDDGTDDFTEVEWGEDRSCQCVHCKKLGVVKDFRIATKDTATP